MITCPNCGYEFCKDLDYPPWLNLELWLEFIAHRKALRKPLTPQAEKYNLSRLEGLLKQGWSQQEIITTAIERGWQSFYAPKSGLELRPAYKYVSEITRERGF